MNFPTFGIMYLLKDSERSENFFECFVQKLSFLATAVAISRGNLLHAFPGSFESVSESSMAH